MNTKNPRKILSVTKPYMPPLQEFHAYLERIWESRWITNNGPVHKEFENALRHFLGIKHICLFANGTLALVAALKSLSLKGEIITTPFTSVSTAQAIYWNNLEPVFVDINKTDLNINIAEIEKAITPKTSAILPVHIFGNPCDVDSINKLAQKYNVKIVYDAAHCFGVQMNGTSVCNFGDLSVLSFHATKVFNSIEGGAIICHDETIKSHIDTIKNSGQNNQHQVVSYGLNSKMNEIQAAFGMALLPYVEHAIECRKVAVLSYRKLLQDIRGIHFFDDKENVKHNYSYFPIIINPVEYGASRDELMNYMEGKNLDARKYFHPLVSDYPSFNLYKASNLSVAREIADNVLCLPLFHDITLNEITAVVDSISHFSQNKAVTTNRTKVFYI